MTKEVQKWADEYMFTAEPSDAAAGPKVYLLGAPADPLGHIAACAKMYKGEVVRNLADVTDDERREYLGEMQKTKLKMPLEAVNLHFMIEGVTRGFTHQMVRQRTAAYAQESTRFAVKEDLSAATALPPSLAGFGSPDHPTYEYATIGDRLYSDWKHDQADVWHVASPEERNYLRWRRSVDVIGEAYMEMVNTGMPAEDARGLMPTNITTRLNYITNLRGLLDHAGNRLCTQAQFEWRMAFAQIAQAMRDYGKDHLYRVNQGGVPWELNSGWQWDAIADLLKPVCYQTGSCAFKADFDRKCSIRSRVDANADINRPSNEWDKEHENGVELDHAIVSGVGDKSVVRSESGTPVFIGAIQPREWLADPSAAR